MIRVSGALIAALAASGWGAGRAAAQDRQVIRMEADAARDEYRFDPANVTARPGDILVFRAASGAPHSVVFEAARLDPKSRAVLNGAMPRRSADLSSPLLTRNGAEYRITVPDLPAGRYQFFCLPHRAYDMRGELEIRP